MGNYAFKFVCEVVVDLSFSNIFYRSSYDLTGIWRKLEYKTTESIFKQVNISYAYLLDGVK